MHEESHCWCYCSLVRVLLWSVVTTRTHTQPSWKRGRRRETQQATRAVILYPFTETAQAPTNTTGQMIQRGYAAPRALCAGPPSAASIASAFELRKRSRTVSRAPQLSAARYTSPRRRDLVACPTNHRCLSLINLLVTRIGLVLLHCLYRL